MVKKYEETLIFCENVLYGSPLRCLQSFGCRFRQSCCVIRFGFCVSTHENPCTSNTFQTSAFRSRQHLATVDPRSLISRQTSTAPIFNMSVARSRGFALLTSPFSTDIVANGSGCPPGSTEYLLAGENDCRAHFQDIDFDQRTGNLSH
jgi:hypothetical protein